MKVIEKFTLKILINKVSNKFFEKHDDILEIFIKNLIAYYENKEENIDIKHLKSYKSVFRMRIKNYRVIYSLENGEIKIIKVLLANSRGDVYKKFSK